ncbi:MAG TPA: STAS domain-containing protein [Leptospiraceae bacterium]|nr:STAS domain-containing protein [Leptospiraceae bacterium]
MIIDRKTEGDFLQFLVNGEVNISNAAFLRKEAEQAILAGSFKILVDLEKVQYMDSSGVGTLVHIQQLLENHKGILHLRNVSESIRKLFEKMSVIEMFKLT